MKFEENKSDRVVPNIVLLGINHKTAPVELRECIAFSEDETDISLEALKDISTIEEVVIFSTCNRVEVLMTTRHQADAVADVKQFLSDFKSSPLNSESSFIMLPNSFKCPSFSKPSFFI